MVVQASIILWTTNYGLGRRPSDLKGVNVLPLIKLTPHALFLALIAAGLSKLSFFITLIRVAPKRWQKIALWVVAIHSTILVAGGSIIGYVDCNFYRRPDRQHPDHCLSERTSKILALTVLMHGAIVVSGIPPVDMQAFQADKKCLRNSFYLSCPPCCSGTLK